MNLPDPPQPDPRLCISPAGAKAMLTSSPPNWLVTTGVGVVTRGLMWIATWLLIQLGLDATDYEEKILSFVAAAAPLVIAVGWSFFCKWRERQKLPVPVRRTVSD